MLSYIIKRLVLDTLYFPLWWYTRGFKRVLKWASNSLSRAERTAALKIWLKSMFKPMFQDYTKEGRIISFFIRFVLLFFKLLMMGVWLIAVVLFVLLWLALPLVIIWLLIQTL